MYDLSDSRESLFFKDEFKSKIKKIYNWILTIGSDNRPIEYSDLANVTQSKLAEAFSLFYLNEVNKGIHGSYMGLKNDPYANRLRKIQIFIDRRYSSEFCMWDPYSNNMREDPLFKNTQRYITQWLFCKRNLSEEDSEKQDCLGELASAEIECTKKKLRSGDFTFSELDSIFEDVANKCKELRFKVYSYLLFASRLRLDMEQGDAITRIIDSFDPYIRSYYNFFMDLKPYMGK